jgi:ABC-type sugar transport system substrate-binding protein
MRAGRNNLRAGTTVKKWKFVVSVPGDNVYLQEQMAAARAKADALGVELQVINAQMDAVAQSQQLLKFVQSPGSMRPDGLLVEPVSAPGFPRVAEAAAAAGIGWVISNALVDYLGALRKTAKAPVFSVSQDHAEIGRIQGRQIGALLPQGGAILYLRGPAMNAVASQRFEGLESAAPKHIEVKSLKVQGSTADSAYNAVCSWLSLSTVRPEGLRMVVSQNVDFILGARKAFDTNTAEPDRAKWLTLPCGAAGVANQVKPLVQQGVLSAAVITSLTMDMALEMLVQATKTNSQPPQQTFVEAHSYPALDELAKKRNKTTV